MRRRRRLLDGLCGQMSFICVRCWGKRKQKDVFYWMWLLWSFKALCTCGQDLVLGYQVPVFVCLFFISTPPPLLQPIVYLGFQYNLPPFLMVSNHCMPVLSPHQPLPAIFYVVFPFFLFFGCSYCSLFWHSAFFILSTWPYRLNWRDFISFAILSPLICLLSPCLFVFSSILLLLQVRTFSLQSVFVPLFSHPYIRTEIHNILGRELEVLTLAHELVLHSWQ